MLSTIKKSTKTILSAIAVGSLVATTSLAPVPAMAHGHHGWHHGHHGHWGGHRGHWRHHHHHHHHGGDVAAAIVGAAIVGAAIDNYNNSCHWHYNHAGQRYSHYC